MSQRTVIGTVKSCLEDATYGLVAKVKLVAAEIPAGSPVGADQIRTDFQFSDSRAPAMLMSTASPQVGVLPRRWDPGYREANLRDGVMRFEIRVEYFDADETIVKANADLCADALALVIDGLVDFSVSVHGPVVEVQGPPMMIVESGRFEDPASTGFLATIQVQERTVYP